MDNGDCRIGLPRLTMKQGMIQSMLMTGVSIKRIAYHLDQSVHTINSHVKSLYTIYGVNSRRELLVRLSGALEVAGSLPAGLNGGVVL